MPVQDEMFWNIYKRNSNALMKTKVIEKILSLFIDNHLTSVKCEKYLLRFEKIIAML